MIVPPALLRPLIVPSSYWDEAPFPAPRIKLASDDLALTCVLLENDSTIQYVTPAQAAEWAAGGVAWAEAAIAQLRLADDGLVWTHERRRDNGDLMWLGFMNPDGLGSSRLLLRSELERRFPAGYDIAIPDRSCGLAVTTLLDPEELADILDLVGRMFDGAVTPMISDMRSPDCLTPVAP
jgi:hypothetical protein